MNYFRLTKGKISIDFSFNFAFLFHMKKIFFVGITGNFGSGKTTVCKFIETRGYEVIYSDRLAKELMNKNEKLRAKIIEYFGSQTYLTNGSLNAKWLAEIVFSDTEEGNRNLNLLNSIVHPFVLEETEKIINKLIKQGKDLIFFESALIYEACIEDLFDYVILVISDHAKIVDRLLATGNFSSEQICQRLKKQIPPEEKKNLADITIINNGTFEELQRNVDFVLEMLKELQTLDSYSKNNN